MNLARIAELLEPYLGPAGGQRLEARDLASISTYIDILQRWNARVNLTAIRNEEEIVTRHFGESLFAARHLFPSRVATRVLGDKEESSPTSASDRDQILSDADAPHSDDGRAALERRDKCGEIAVALAPVIKLADVGSGAGFPGIPIKLWAPQLSLTLIESNHKKATFLREVSRALILTNVNIQNVRAESLTGKRFDVVTLRAVERFQSTLPTAAGLLSPKGRLVLLISSSQLPTAQATLPSLNWREPVVVPPSDSRILLVGSLPI